MQTIIKAKWWKMTLRRKIFGENFPPQCHPIFYCHPEDFSPKDLIAFSNIFLTSFSLKLLIIKMQNNL